MHTRTSYLLSRQRGRRQFWFGATLLARGVSNLLAGIFGPVAAIVGGGLSMAGQLLELVASWLAVQLTKHANIARVVLMFILVVGALVAGALSAAVILNSQNLVRHLLVLGVVALLLGLTIWAVIRLVSHLNFRPSYASHSKATASMSWLPQLWERICLFFRWLAGLVAQRLQFPDRQDGRRPDDPNAASGVFEAGSLVSVADDAGLREIVSSHEAAQPLARSPRVAITHRADDAVFAGMADDSKVSLISVSKVSSSFISITFFEIAFLVLLTIFSIAITIEIYWPHARESESVAVEPPADRKPIQIDLREIWGLARTHTSDAYRKLIDYQVSLAPLFGRDMNWREESSLVMEHRDTAMLRRDELRIDRSLLCGSRTLVAVGLASKSGPIELNRELAYQRSLLLAKVLWIEALSCPQAEFPATIATSFPAGYGGASQKDERPVLAFALPRDIGLVGSKALERKLDAELKQRIGSSESTNHSRIYSACRFESRIHAEDRRYAGLLACELGNRPWLAS